jgi:Ran GTPase-activating protein (RanGAP) involved in mRNA processing and transport
MSIIRGGDAEYDSSRPTLEELAPRIEEAITSSLGSNSKILKLSGKYYSTDEITLLARSTQVSEVLVLDLEDNQIGDAALKILTESIHFLNLEVLNLGVNFITDEGIKEWANSSEVTLKNIKSLSLSDNKLTDDSLVDFVKSSNLPKLESLDIGWMEAGNKTAIAIGISNNLPCLKKLDLERSYVDAEGIRSLIGGKTAENFEELNLAANKFGDEGVRIIAQTSNLRNLKVLNLSQNMIGDDGAKAIGTSTQLSGLTHLYLGRNAFGPEGAKAIHETKILTQLKTLVLQEGVETTPDLVNYSRPELLRPEDPELFNLGK